MSNESLKVGAGSAVAPVVVDQGAAASGNAQSLGPTNQSTLRQLVPDSLESKAQAVVLQQARAPGARAQLQALEQGQPVKVIQQAMDRECGKRGFFDRMSKHDEHGVLVTDGIYLTRVGFRAYERTESAYEFRPLSEDALGALDIDKVQEGLGKILDTLRDTGKLPYMRKEELRGVLGIFDDILR